MTEHPIPAASLNRLRVALQQFQDLGQVVVEAMGLSDRNVRLNLERGVIEEVQNGEALAPTPNGQVEAVA